MTLAFPINRGPVNAIRQNLFTTKVNPDTKQTWETQIGRIEDSGQLSGFPQSQLDEVKKSAICNASQFQVSAIAYTDRGAFPGVNIEFPGGGYNDSIHAEQFAIMNARAHGAKELIALDSSESPCGHCRQFMLEAGKPDLPIRFSMPKENNSSDRIVIDTLLSDLLPHPFSLSDGSSNIFSGPKSSYAPALSQFNKNLTNKNLNAAASAKLELGSKSYTGYLAESAAWNPTIAPAQDAFIRMYSRDGLPKKTSLVADIYLDQTKMLPTDTGINLQPQTVTIETAINNLVTNSLGQ